jgi:hypothetical protein
MAFFLREELLPYGRVNNKRAMFGLGYFLFGNVRIEKQASLRKRIDWRVYF